MSTSQRTIFRDASRSNCAARGGRAARGGFTLLELVLVLAMLATVMAITAPSLRNFGRGRGAGDTAAQIVALAEYARTQAITRGISYRLNVDVINGRYWLTMQDGLDFIELGEEFGRVFTVPDGVRLEWDDSVRFSVQAAQNGVVLPQAIPGDGQFAEFFPSGRTEPSLIRVIWDNGATTPSISEVICPSATETFRILRPDEMTVR